MNKKGYWGYAIFIVILAIILLVIVGLFTVGKKNVNTNNETVSDNSNASEIMRVALNESDASLCGSLKSEIGAINCRIKVYADLKNRSYCESLKNSNFSVNMQLNNQSIIVNVGDFCKYQYTLRTGEDYCDVSDPLKDYCMGAIKR